MIRQLLIYKDKSIKISENKVSKFLILNMMVLQDRNNIKGGSALETSRTNL
jgi:hypothetical protein